MPSLEFEPQVVFHIALYDVDLPTPENDANARNDGGIVRHFAVTENRG